MRVFWWQLGLHLEPETSEESKALCLLVDNFKFLSIASESSKDSGVAGSPDAWVFPSKRMKTPVAKDNCWRRHFFPKLKSVGLGCLNSQVMRRTHASLMRGIEIDPKIVADQLGRSLDVNLNVYTQTALDKRKEAVDALESALQVI